MVRAATTGRVFYGWVVTVAAFTVLATSYGIQFSFGVLLPRIVEDTGWSRAEISLAFSVYIFGYSALSVFSGVLTDRLGPRRVIAIGGVILGVAYVLVGLVQSQWQLYIALGVVGSIGMSAAFVPCSTTVARWFVRRRGLAVGLTTSGGSFGALLFAPVVGLILGVTTWRVTYIGLGVLVAVVLVTASRLIHGQPEVLGLRPDGDDPAEPIEPRVLTADSSPSSIDLEGYTLSESVRTFDFWLMTSVFFMTWLVVFLPLVHLAPFAEDLGASPAVAGTIISATGIGSMIGRVSAGTISDKLGRPPVLMVAVMTQIVAFVAFASVTSLPALYPAAIVLGLGYGGTTSMFPALFGDRFGRAHVGAIVGLVFSVAGSVAAFGPAFAGFVYDATGSYRVAFVVSALANGVSFGLATVVWLRQRRIAHQLPQPVLAR